uniref:Rab3-GAP regulatory subunit N-terminal domain-containing protein n=1 Tax=Meloidogyne enterolobii TaxID=390850 RepID=A0A6V7Y254_MELEN|nr:unnamed protein product [Meloidogyne enterolobii]
MASSHFNRCQANLSIVVIASAQRFVILENSESKTMEISTRVDATKEDFVYISALNAFGISSLNSSRNSEDDWTCICVCLSNGNLLFYSQEGKLLFTEKCASTSIVSVKLCPSFCPGNQELVLLTADSRLIAIEGLSLCVALRAACVYISTGERTAKELSSVLQLNAQQFNLYNINGVNDVLSTGITQVCAFDQYIGAFMAGGRSEPVTREQSPSYLQYICTVGSRGKGEEGASGYDSSIKRQREFVNFVWRSTQPLPGTLTDALFSLTSKISNNIPSFGFRSFLGVGTSRIDQPRQKQQLSDSPTTQIYSKSFLKDGKRKSERTFVAPNGWNLMVIVDNIGRILLINTKMRRILRIWKGYRQARCGWIEKQQKCSSNSHPSKALFLIIYVPRRGLLEVWSMQNGPRISAFEVDDGRLISINCGILCGNDEILEGNKANSSKSSNVIFLSSEGLFYSIDVPFNSSNNPTTIDKLNLTKLDQGLN